MTKLHPKEADTKAAIKKLLTKYGWHHWMPVASHGFGTNGASDHHAIKNGVFLCIEAKHKDKKGSTLQEQFGAAIIENGGFYRVVNLAQCEDGSAEAWIAKLTREVDKYA